MVYRATVGAAPSGLRTYGDSSTTVMSTEDRNRVFYERLATCQNKGGTGNVITTGQQQQILGINGLNQYRMGQQHIIPVATAGGGAIRYISRVPTTSTREVTNLRQIQQNAGIVGNIARNPIITNVQNIAGNMETLKYSREYGNANGDTLLGNVEMRPSKSGRIIQNGIISINPAANVNALSRKRDGDFLSQQPLPLKKQRILDVAGNSVCHDEYYSRAQLKLSGPDNFELNKLPLSHLAPRQHVSNDVEILAGSFVKGIIANDEVTLGQVNVRAGLEDQVQKIKFRLVELLKSDNVVDDTSDGSGMKSYGQGVVYNGNGGKLLSNGTKPISTNNTKVSSNNVSSEIMIDIEAAIDLAAKKSARKAVQLAYIELKNRHDAMLSKQKRTITGDALEEKTPMINSISDERHSEEIDKLKKCHSAQIKALVKEQELFIAELTDKHLKEQQQSRDDKARKLRNCVLASSNALQVVRDVWDVE